MLNIHFIIIFTEIVLEKGKKISAILKIKRNTLLIIRLARKHIKLQSKKCNRLHKYNS